MSLGEKLDYKACESLEEILKRVQFKVIDLEQTNLDEDVRRSHLKKKICLCLSPSLVLFTLCLCCVSALSLTLILFFTLTALAGCGVFAMDFSDYSRCPLV